MACHLMVVKGEFYDPGASAFNAVLNWAEHSVHEQLCL